MAGPVSIRFVLVRPVKALNIGAAARAMANFGLNDLVLVDPEPRQWRDAESGIYASDLLTNAPVLSLKEAIADCHLVVGTASAHNRERQRTTLTLPALEGWLRKELPKGGKTAVLFGSERNGLDNGELDFCHALLRIPTASDAPSMNLGQAVALIAYECSRAGLESSVREFDNDLLEGRQLEVLVDAAMRAMARSGVNAHLDDEQKRQKFRRGLLRWRMSRKDAAWLQGLIERLMEPARPGI